MTQKRKEDLKGAGVFSDIQTKLKSTDERSTGERTQVTGEQTRVKEKMGITHKTYVKGCQYHTGSIYLGELWHNSLSAAYYEIRGKIIREMRNTKKDGM